MAFVHEAFTACKGERREEDPRSAIRDKRFSKTSNFNASLNVKETKQLQSDHCPLANGTHKMLKLSIIHKDECEGSKRSSEEATLMLRMSRQRTRNQRL